MAIRFLLANTAGQLLFFVGAFGASLSNGEDKEPPLIMHLEVEGRKIPIEFDKPLSLAALGGGKNATLRVAPQRVFAYGGLTFEYPREYTFEADLSDPEAKLWTLSGSDFVIMVHRYKGQSDHVAQRRELLAEMRRLYRDAKPKISATEWKAGGTMLKGDRIAVTVATANVQQDVFSAPAGEDSVILILQDSLADDGAPSKDRLRAEKMLRESLRLPAK